MTAPTKSTSRWGSFLQQAVAGVESRLDDILAEDSKPKPAPPPASDSVASARVDVVSRSGSPGTRSNDRLQDRLAKALANKSATTNPRSRTRSPHANTSSPRGSLDTTRSDIGRSSISLSRETATDGSRDSTSFVKPTSSVEEVEVEVTEDPQGEIWGVSPRVSMEASAAQPLRTSTDCSRDTRTARNTGAAHGSKDRPSELSPADYEALISKLNGDIERSELERQNESRDYVEKIDGLQAKLQYLANESLHSAKSLANQAPADSLEVKIAAKEQQIALLMQEGQRLSKKEMVQTNMIKKLRAQAEEQSKAIKSAAERCEKAEGERELLSEHARQVLGIEKQLAEKTRQHSHLQKEADRLRLERDANQDTVLELKALLEEAIAADNEAENTNAIEALEKEKKLVVELNDEVARVKLEKELADDRARSKINELTAKIEILSEENRLSIMEAKAEHTLLEGRLEAMRARAEEVSSSATGDAQAKLLRQIETLQSQYSVASENWQGIETSLVARIAILEKERDELAKKEQDLRRKARENSMKHKQDEESLQEMRSMESEFRGQISDLMSQLVAVQLRAHELETASAAARAEFDNEKQAWVSELQQRIDEERAKWREERLGQNVHLPSRAESPPVPNRRGLTSEFLGLQNVQTRRPVSRSSTSEFQGAPLSERLKSRRMSNQPSPLLRSPTHATAESQDTSALILSNGDLPGTPSIQTFDADEFFEHHRSASPQQTLNDMGSVSTAAAGPSVQLIERMSSAVRKLESEKAASKEQMLRLAAQRDEARAEIVALMKEVEIKREAEKKVAQIEHDMKNMNDRYQTTLEMLGEKSELVDELRGDIDEIKTMYRDLVERTVR